MSDNFLISQLGFSLKNSLLELIEAPNLQTQGDRKLIAEILKDVFSLLLHNSSLFNSELTVKDAEEAVLTGLVRFNDLCKLENNEQRLNNINSSIFNLHA